MIGLPGTQIFGQTLFGCICEGIFWILTFKSIDECDQNGRVRGHGSHLPAVNTSKMHLHVENSHWKLTEGWQKFSYTTKAVRKIHIKLSRKEREVTRSGPLPLRGDSEEKGDYMDRVPPQELSNSNHILHNTAQAVASEKDRGNNYWHLQRGHIRSSSNLWQQLGHKVQSQHTSRCHGSPTCPVVHSHPRAEVAEAEGLWGTKETYPNQRQSRMGATIASICQKKPGSLSMAGPQKSASYHKQRACTAPLVPALLPAGGRILEFWERRAHIRRELSQLRPKP